MSQFLSWAEPVKVLTIFPGIAQVKTSCWKQLPWLLCGLALPDEEEARSIARQAIDLFQQSSIHPMVAFAKNHMMTRRFLDYDFQGDDSIPNDHALRPSLDEFLDVD